MDDKKHTGVVTRQISALRADAKSTALKDKITKSSERNATKPSPRNKMSSRRSNSSRSRGTRITDSFIFFWGGPLSNWNQGTPFSGHRAMDLLLSRLQALNLGDACPSPQQFTTKLLRSHDFLCGEQWMMACKAWLFETMLYDLGKSEWQSPTDEFEAIRQRLMSPTAPEAIREKDMYSSSLCRILRAHHPKDQKQLGRSIPNFNEEIWSKVNTLIVIAGSIARAEKDPDLAAMYESNRDGKREFVEGSPHDKIWGVGIKFDDERIENRENWKGENRLGKCHDEACREFRLGKKEED